MTATLLDNFPHALLGADSVLIGGIQVKASEADGDFGIGQVRVRVLDDQPNAVDDDPQEVAEDFAGTISGNVINLGGSGDDAPGADDATLTHVKMPGASDFVAITTVTTQLRRVSTASRYRVSAPTRSRQPATGRSTRFSTNPTTRLTPRSPTGLRTGTAIPTRRRSRSP